MIPVEEMEALVNVHFRLVRYASVHVDNCQIGTSYPCRLVHISEEMLPVSVHIASRTCHLSSASAESLTFNFFLCFWDSMPDNEKPTKTVTSSQTPATMPSTPTDPVLRVSSRTFGLQDINDANYPCTRLSTSLGRCAPGLVQPPDSRSLRNRCQPRPQRLSPHCQKACSDGFRRARRTGLGQVPEINACMVLCLGRSNEWSQELEEWEVIL